MKSLIKPIIMTALAMAVGLSCTIANAKDHQLTTNKHILNNVVYVYIAPSIEGGGELTTVDYISRSTSKKLLELAKNNSKTQKSSCKSKRKSSLYELTTIFNDKLQTFLAYISGSGPTKIASVNKDKNNLPESKSITQ